jgi:hypothetical protein
MPVSGDTQGVDTHLVARLPLYVNVTTAVPPKRKSLFSVGPIFIVGVSPYAPPIIKNTIREETLYAVRCITARPGAMTPQCSIEVIIILPNNIGAGEAESIMWSPNRLKTYGIYVDTHDIFLPEGPRASTR